MRIVKKKFFSTRPRMKRTTHSSSLSPCKKFTKKIKIKTLFKIYLKSLLPGKLLILKFKNRTSRIKKVLKNLSRSNPHTRTNYYFYQIWICWAPCMCWKWALIRPEMNQLSSEKNWWLIIIQILHLNNLKKISRPLILSMSLKKLKA